MSTKRKLLQLLTSVYGEETAATLAPRLLARMAQFRREQATPRSPSNAPFSERDVVLITYGDQIQEPGVPPLQTLNETLTALVGGLINGLHILPFYPWSSDDGFSVIDYRQVDPAWGSWVDVRRLSTHFRLMVDAVINHISAESAWFQRFRSGDAPQRDFFITLEPTPDVLSELAKVTRPRTSPLLTPVQTASGMQHVWTTFSADQVDLNYASPELLLAVVEVLLFYVAQGAQLIRLDAIGFLWKALGTSCIHLPQTHALIQLFRAMLDEIAPGVVLVTETNVPHAENVRYFGDGTNEAQMVYNFTLPPLALHAFITGDATHLSRWAATLAAPSDQTTFFNFMASHDGIGVRPVEGILSPQEVQRLVERTKAHGGFVSYKSNADGSQSAYELNITYFDALNNPAALNEGSETSARVADGQTDGRETVEQQVDRFIASQAILLALAGVPGTYVHSLFGSRNWRAGVAETGRYRTINRQKFERARLDAELADAFSLRAQVFRRYAQLIRARTGEAAFHPNGAQTVLDLHPALFALRRTSPSGESTVLCLHNVSAQAIGLDWQMVGGEEGVAWCELQTQAIFTRNARLTLPPYGVLWLQSAASKQSPQKR